jgi:hypothetical protein
MTTFRIKRIYEELEPSDGYRVLVDRLWPRGISKEKAALDEWCKDIAPSNELREWFGHDPSKYAEFKVRYQQELAQNSELPAIISNWLAHQQVTLLFGAKDAEHNQAEVLLEYLQSH